MEKELWRCKFIEYFMVNFLYLHVTENTRVGEADKTSVLDLILMCNNMEKENIKYDTPFRKSDHVVLDLTWLMRTLKGNQRGKQAQRENIV